MLSSFVSRWLQSKSRKPANRRPHFTRLWLEVLEDRTLLATLTVTNLNDAGAGSLRTAVADARSIAFPGDDTIVFQAGLTGVIQLNSALMELNTNLDIVGPGPDVLTVSRNTAAAPFRLFHILDGVRSSISGLTLTNGTDTPTGGGGGIFNGGGQMTITNCTISNNTGSGIFNSNGNMTITGSTISGNSGDYGGGIASGGTLTVTSSTIAGNSGFLGGGIYFYTGTMYITSSTIAGNNVNGQGGGIYQVGGGALTIGNTIVASNTAPGFPDIFRAVASQGNNLIGNTSGSGGFLPSDLLNVNPLLGPLQDNGGPTLTRALLFGSPAIDAGNPAVVFNPAEFDQRGAPFVRVFGSRVDMGAFEAVPLVVNSAGDGDDGDLYNGVTTLREAINRANVIGGADTITFAASMSGQTILLGGAELAVTDALTIDAAPLAQNVTINANLQSRILNITADYVTLTGLTLTGGRTTASRGGGIRATGVLTLVQSTVSGNSTAGDFANGGGIFSFGAVTLTQSTVSGNSTAGYSAAGGGIYAAGAVTLTQSTVSGNSTAGNFSYGGGIRASAVTLTQSTVSGNSTTGHLADGGGICANGAVTLTQSTVSGNSTAGNFAEGGGIYAAGAVTLTQSTVTGNHTTGSGSLGGGIYQPNLNNNFPLSISGSIIAGNTAADSSPDLKTDPESVAVANSVSYSLIGNTSGSGVTAATGTGNLLNVNPLLGPLADNGGTTLTHALLAGSPALDAGDPAVTTGVDQRGFARVVDGDAVSGARIDIGAFESQAPSFPNGDYNHNNTVDAADYVVWRKTLGQTGVGLPANGDNSGASENIIDQADYIPWRANYGNTTTPPGAGASGGMATAFSTPDAEETISNNSNEMGDSTPDSESIVGRSITSANSRASGSGDISFAFANSEGGTPRSTSTKPSTAFASVVPAVSIASSNQLLLALDQAIAELNADSESFHCLSDTRDARPEQESASSPEGSLAVALIDWD